MCWAGCTEHAPKLPLLVQKEKVALGGLPISPPKWTLTLEGPPCFNSRRGPSQGNVTSLAEEQNSRLPQGSWGKRLQHTPEPGSAWPLEGEKLGGNSHPPHRAFASGAPTDPGKLPGGVGGGEAPQGQEEHPGLGQTCGCKAQLHFPFQWLNEWPGPESHFPLQHPAPSPHFQVMPAHL